MGRMDGKVVLVTGAARGMGASHARRLTEEGATVVLTDVLDEEGAKTAADLGARYERLDVREEADWQRVVGGLDRLDVLVNNAGVLLMAPLAETSLAEYMEVVNVNQVGVFLGIQAAAPLMRASGGGSIVNISSSAGLQGGSLLMAYGASKWAVRGMTKCAALELAGDGIRVNSVHPGTVVTPMVGDDAEDLDRRCADVPVGRAARTDEISSLVLFLASDDSAYCTGSEFVVDGGATAGVVIEQD